MLFNYQVKENFSDGVLLIPERMAGRGRGRGKKGCGTAVRIQKKAPPRKKITALTRIGTETYCTHSKRPAVPGKTRGGRGSREKEQRNMQASGLASMSKAVPFTQRQQAAKEEKKETDSGNMPVESRTLTGGGGLIKKIKEGGRIFLFVSLFWMKCRPACRWRVDRAPGGRRRVPK